MQFGNQLESVRRLFGDTTDEDRRRAQAQLQSNMTESTAALVGSESPLRRGRSMVAVLASAPQALEGLVGSLRDSEQAPLIQGDLAIVSGNRVPSYRVGDTYTTGRLPIWLYPSWLLRDNPLAVLAVLLLGALLVTLVFYWALRRRAVYRSSVPRAH